MNNHDEFNQGNILCAALIEKIMVGNEQEAKKVLQLHHLLHTGNYKVGMAFGARGIWTASMVILDAGTGPNLMREAFIVSAWTPFLRTMKAGRLRSPSNSSTEAEGFISLPPQVGQLHKKVGCFVVPGFAGNMF